MNIGTVVSITVIEQLIYFIKSKIILIELIFKNIICCLTSFENNRPKHRYVRTQILYLKILCQIIYSKQDKIK